MSKPKSKMLTLPDFVAKNGVGSFLEPKDLCAVAQTCRQNRNLYKNNCKTSELLFYGVNINKARKKKLLELLATEKLSQEAQSIILTRVNARQVFTRPICGPFDHSYRRYCNSNNRGPIAMIRTFANLSPLEAAVLCGDFHLVQLLLDNLAQHQNQEGIKQLKRIREGLESDPRSFVSLIISVQNAYKDYVEKKGIKMITQDNYDELDYSYALIGESQKNLPWFILQNFCRSIPCKPLPNFRNEPERACLYIDGAAFDWDAIGRYARTAILNHQGGARPSFGRHRLFDCAEVDSAALGKLSEVILSELDRIIKLQEQKLMVAAYPNPEQGASHPSPPGGLSLGP